MSALTEVYIVTQGSYSDYGICAVFLDRALADEYCAQRAGGHESPWVETWSIGTLLKPPGWRGFAVTMAEDGAVNKVTSIPVDEAREDWDEYNSERTGSVSSGLWERKDVLTGHRTFHVTTDMDEEGAIKVANERRAQIIALNQWPKAGEEKVW